MSDGTAFGGYGVVGLEAPISRNLSVFGEGRWTKVDADLQGDFDGFGKIDLSGLRGCRRALLDSLIPFMPVKKKRPALRAPAVFVGGLGSLVSVRHGIGRQGVAEEQPAFAVGGAPEGEGEGVAELRGEVDLVSLSAHLLRQVLEVGLVVLAAARCSRDPGAHGAEDLLLDARRSAARGRRG